MKTALRRVVEPRRAFELNAVRRGAVAEDAAVKRAAATAEVRHIAAMARTFVVTDGRRAIDRSISARRGRRRGARCAVRAREVGDGGGRQGRRGVDDDGGARGSEARGAAVARRRRHRGGLSQLPRVIRSRVTDRGRATGPRFDR